MLQADFYPKGREKPEEDFKQRSDMIRYTFQKDHSEESLEGGLEEAMDGGREIVRKFAHSSNCKLIGICTRSMEADQEGRGGVGRYKEVKPTAFSYLLTTEW